jgi:hypothetical protein
MIGRSLVYFRVVLLLYSDVAKTLSYIGINPHASTDKTNSP